MNHQRIYETTFIVNAALEDPDVEAVITKITNQIESLGATIIQINKWGRRRLVYPINKKTNGYYVHCIYEASPSIIPIFERFLILEDTVLRHLTLALPKKLREHRLQMIAEGKSTEIAPQEAPKQDQPTTEASAVATETQNTSNGNIKTQLDNVEAVSTN
ncbi:MAG: 30S ribosomal protein S6 [Candidatus Kapaibacteriales bacterium]